MSKFDYLSYKLDYDITAALFCPDRRYYFVLISDIIRIFHITSYLACSVLLVLHSYVLVVVVDIICIGYITKYLARNFYPKFHILSSSVSDWCIVAFLSYFSDHDVITGWIDHLHGCGRLRMYHLL